MTDNSSNKEEVKESESVCDFVRSFDICLNWCRENEHLKSITFSQYACIKWIKVYYVFHTMCLKNWWVPDNELVRIKEVLL